MHARGLSQCTYLHICDDMDFPHTKGHTSNPRHKCPKRGFMITGGQIPIEKRYRSLSVVTKGGYLRWDSRNPPPPAINARTYKPTGSLSLAEGRGVDGSFGTSYVDHVVSMLGTFGEYRTSTPVIPCLSLLLSFQLGQSVSCKYHAPIRKLIVWFQHFFQHLECSWWPQLNSSSQTWWPTLYLLTYCPGRTPVYRSTTRPRVEH